MTENAQLTLIDTPRSWKLDERTREVGREGVARARAALRAGLHTRTQTASGASPPRRGAAGGAPRRHAA
ncbi:MAG TPA: hypothetical protein VHK25_04050 [Acidimicrobiales bacterium]|jgi:hypothetical protein|nr:hypothetical protein [Acidimicrobiales bacterium]